VWICGNIIYAYRIFCLHAHSYSVAFGQLGFDLSPFSVAIVVLDESVDDVALHLVDGGALVAALQPLLVLRQDEQLLQLPLRWEKAKVNAQKVHNCPPVIVSFALSTANGAYALSTPCRPSNKYAKSVNLFTFIGFLVFIECI